MRNRFSPNGDAADSKTSRLVAVYVLGRIREMITTSAVMNSTTPAIIQRLRTSASR